ncbi:DUF4232 domain-containing protein [Streptomyces sp. NPDC006632]|uniref:DUF4232 domain-containing protein n=1 Tax=unclassified Streptomyces TaxID=2593676 RepID=UPI002E24D529
MHRSLVPVRRSWRGLPPIGAVVLATLTVATACGEGGGSASQSPSTPQHITTTPVPTDSTPSASESMPSATASAPHTPAATPPAGTPAAARPSSASTAGAPRCAAGRLHVSLGRISPGAGNIYVPLVFTNTGTSACGLLGFPGVSLLSASGARIGAPAQREGGALPLVLLSPGKPAYASLHTVNEGVSDKPCWQSATWIQAYPPGSTVALRIPANSLRICGAAFDVSALRPGQSP